MTKTFKGTNQRKGKKVAIVASEFNEHITKRLLDGCVKELKANGLKDNDIIITWVPGSLEIPVVAQNLARRKNVLSVICLGAVIRGETIHFELVANECARGIARVSLDTNKPVIFGVLATENLSQAQKRSEKGNNKGKDAAIAALEMADLFLKLNK